MQSQILGWRGWWVVFYAIGLVLIPPIHHNGKEIFSSEWMLIPLLFIVGLNLVKGKLRGPPGPLLVLWGISVLVFLAGFFRGDAAVKISIYDLAEHKYFGLFDDAKTFLRMVILFSTPWIIRNSLKENEKSLPLFLPLFLRALKICMLISAGLAILDYKGIHLINLENLGYYVDAQDFWTFRAHGTFITPIEASFMYGAIVVYLLTSGVSLKEPLNLVTLFLNSVVVVLTHGGTAFVAIVICFLVHLFWKKSDLSKRGFILGFCFLAACGGLAFLVLPKVFFLQKIGDLIYRQRTYTNYLSLLAQKPRLILTGIGFSRVCSDNNIILLFIQGGIFFFAAVAYWINTLMKKVPESLVLVFLFWFLSALSFDTLGYWGIGRLGWFLLGLIGV
jgi:hypothetical protein